MTHRIRLRGPWELELVDGPRAGSMQRIRLPDDWSAIAGRHLHRCVRLRRYFHCPTGLGVGDQLWLIVAEARGVKAIVLNDSPLECSRPDTTIALPITAHVAERNLLTLDLAPLDDQAGAAWSDVLLEIRPAESR